MKNLLPRLRNLLVMLAAEPAPLPVKEVADRLRVSKRTVFRELAHIDNVLAPYGLEIGSKPGQGVVLEGPEKARNSLLRDIRDHASADPADKQDRLDRLVLEVLRRPGQKVATYADYFKVSPPTISHDLGVLEPWLEKRGLGLQRKTGSGIVVTGPEMKIRRAVIALVQRLRQNERQPAAYPNPDIRLDILDLAPELDPILAWMTPQSHEALLDYLVTMVQRVMDANGLPRLFESGTTEDALAEAEMTAAREITRILHETFNIAVDASETAALAIEIAACRPKVPETKKRPGDDALVPLAREMTSRFDPARAPLLLLDDTLQRGLVSHLRSAVHRIKHHIEIVDPMLPQLSRSYPWVMERSRAACQALLPYGDWISEAEISLFATHFGAALMRQEEEGPRQRPLRVGVICVHGIGSSYLLASEVKRAFGSRITVEVVWHDDTEKCRHYDLLVSTIALPGAAIPVISVPPIPGEEDIRRIGDMLAGKTAAAAAPKPISQSIVKNLGLLEELAAGARELVSRLAILPVPAAMGVPELAELAGNAFAADREGAQAIARGLLAREKIATQAIPELEIFFLHCRTDGVAKPVFGVIVPENGRFLSAAGDGLSRMKAAVVMLVPQASSREIAEMLGSVSAALIENEAFLQAVQAGKEEEVRVGLQAIVAESLYQFVTQKLKG